MGKKSFLACRAHSRKVSASEWIEFIRKIDGKSPVETWLKNPFTKRLGNREFQLLTSSASKPICPFTFKCDRFAWVLFMRHTQTEKSTVVSQIQYASWRSKKNKLTTFAKNWHSIWVEWINYSYTILFYMNLWNSLTAYIFSLSLSSLNHEVLVFFFCCG